jgi:hypothetical protein
LSLINPPHTAAAAAAAAAKYFQMLEMFLSKTQVSK